MLGCGLRSGDPPGTRAKYRNLGYFVLTLIIERAAGVPYVRYMQDHVLARAGMQGASYADKEVVVPRLASAYTVKNGAIVFLRGSMVSQAG
jgi:D-alanyl-D-alanine carboxypeptidase